MKKFFIAGTDTDIGKTYTTELLLKCFNAQGKKTLGLKPIASGAQLKNGRLYNSDAITLLNASSVKNATYEQINPFVFKQPIAPHLAAGLNGCQLTVEAVKHTIEKTLSLIKTDVCLIEGVGGWAVPLNADEYMYDLVHALNFPVILVVGIKLGCLNHAILTAQAIAQLKIPLAGWIANGIAPETLLIEENIATLIQRIQAPFLGTIPFKSQCYEQLNSAALCSEISPTENAST